MKTYVVHCLSESLSPMTQMSGVAGNVAMIAREPVLTERGEMWVPYLSGNAFRHRCVREPGMLWLIDRYNLEAELSLDQQNFLLHGGNLTKSNARENTKRIADMHRTWPLLHLLGGSLPDQILSGFMDVWRGMLVCEENRKYLLNVPEARLYSAQRFIGEYQYTRGDAVKYGMGEPGASQDDEKSNLMIFAGQCVQRGSMWQHGFLLKHVSEIELGALLWSLRLWQREGGTIGGQSSRGHGRLRCEILGDGFDQKELCNRYVDYVKEVKDEAIAWLKEAWAEG